jgi:hypothetical protein
VRDEAVNGRVRPGRGQGHEAVFFGVVVNVIDVVLQIAVVADGVFSHLPSPAALPDVGFSPGIEVNIDAAFCEMFDEAHFDMRPAQCVIRIAFRESPYRVKVIR